MSEYIIRHILSFKGFTLYKILFYFLLFTTASFAKIAENSLYGKWHCERTDNVPLNEQSTLQMNFNLDKQFFKDGKSHTEGQIEFFYAMETKKIFLSSYRIQKEFSWRIHNDNLLQKLHLVKIKQLKSSKALKAFESKIDALLKVFYLKDEVSSSKIEKITSSSMILNSVCNNSVLNKMQ